MLRNQYYFGIVRLITLFQNQYFCQCYPRRASEASTVFSGTDLEVYPVIEDEDDVQAVEVHLRNNKIIG